MPARDPAVTPHLPSLSSSHTSSPLHGFAAFTKPDGSNSSLPRSRRASGSAFAGLAMMSSSTSNQQQQQQGSSTATGSDDIFRSASSGGRSRRAKSVWSSLSGGGGSISLNRKDDDAESGNGSGISGAGGDDHHTEGNASDIPSTHVGSLANTSDAIRDTTSRLASMSYQSSDMGGAMGSNANGGATGRPEFMESFSSVGLKIAMDNAEEAVADGSETPRPVGVEVPELPSDKETSPKLDVLNIPSSGPSGLSVMMGRNSRPTSAESSKNSSPVNGTQIPTPASEESSSSSGHLSTVTEERGSGSVSPISPPPSDGNTTPKPPRIATAMSSSTRVDDSEDDDLENLESPSKPKEKDLSSSAAPVIEISQPSPIISERTPLLSSRHSNTPSRLRSTPSHSPARTPTFLQRTRNQVVDLGRSVKKTTWADVLQYGVLEPVSNIPAVILGLLLNVLDGVSYGMIMFPAGYVFTDFGSIGVSMFFVSCIISQLTYTCGGSIFKGGNGSMMIEAVPFFHILVNIITETVGEQNAQAIISTTMVSFALSAILTGTVFMALGAFKLGGLIGYFPRHILVGCISGVGVFLIETGLEVSRGLKEEGFVYNLATLKIFFESFHAIALWTLPLGLAILLRVITHRFHHQLIFPTYFFIIPIIFYIVVAIGGWSFPTLRQNGWVLDVGTSSTQPWYTFYSLFSFRHISWEAIWASLPTQLALVFFGILHVPLNVPALGVSLSEDNVKLDRELIAHGVSNIAAGFFGTVPNYLCYVNTVLFYRVGGGSRLSGLMLAAGTAVILTIGPSAIGFLPVTVVGALIFVLGIDLVIEAVWDTRHRVNKMEYFTIWAITIGMTLLDFVAGLILGIVLASLFFVIQNSRRRAIRATFNGATATSTVRRPHAQRAFIQEVGRQTVVMKLQGFLFFGTITKVEEEIRNLLEIAAWEKNPVRFLIVDFALVHGLDFSSAEAFVRIQRLLSHKDVLLILCGANPNGLVGSALQAVDLWADQHDDGEGPRVEVFENLNDALEWTENAYLTAFYASTRAAVTKHVSPTSLDFPRVDKPPFALSESFANSPRRSHLAQAGDSALPKHELHFNEPQSPILNHTQSQSQSQSQNSTSTSNPTNSNSFSIQNFKQPLPILLQTFSSYTEHNHEFFFQLVSYFKPVAASVGDVIWRQGEMADGLYLIESGCLRATYSYSHSEPLTECMVAGTVAGELSMLSRTKRNATVVAERDSRLWKLSEQDLTKLEKDKPEIARVLVRICMSVAAEEADVLSSHLISVLS